MSTDNTLPTRVPAPHEILVNLQRVVLSTPPEQLWMEAWQAVPESDCHPLARSSVDRSAWSCGTVACVAGHAALDGWFNEHGLRMIRLNGDDGDGLVEYTAPNGDTFVAYRALSMLMAGTKAPDGPSWEDWDGYATRLFDPETYADLYDTPEELRRLVLANINMLLELNPAPKTGDTHAK